MKIFIQYDYEFKIIGFSLEKNEYATHSANLPDDLIDDFSMNYENYKYTDGNIVRVLNVDYIKNNAKYKCDELFSSYTKHIIPNTKEELYLNNVLRDELREYIKDNDIPTPVFNNYALSLGMSDLKQGRVDTYQNILHSDIALADLIAQKQKMYKFIDECEDVEILLEFEPNFHYLAYSNMRWR